MSAQTLVERYRMFLLGLAAFMCVGTVVELLLAEHTEQALQIVPFLLCGAALAAVLVVWVKPTAGTIRAMRLVMGALVLGSLLGVYEHLEGNWEIVLETKPNLATAEMIWQALRGAAPMLAPGILFLVALLAVAATYYHPALQNRA